MTTPHLDACLSALREDRDHGAGELARMAMETAAKEARDFNAGDHEAFLMHLREVARELAATRPSMAPVANLTGAWISSVESLPPGPLDELRMAASAAADALAAESAAAVRTAAARAAHLVADGATVMTHSLSSTVVEMFRELGGRSVKAIVTESRPRNEGHMLAERLSGWAIPVTVITDAQMAIFVPHADLVVVGADSILPDGSLINKAGTCLLALAAREHGVPFYVCAESFKRRPAGMPAVELEEMDPAELEAPSRPGVEAANVYFEITPAHLLTGILSEDENIADRNE